MKVYSPQDLAEANGKNGKPALVTVDGKVYDVSGSRRWADGVHMKRHQSGRDLSLDIKSAPHGSEVLERVELVGTYEEIPRQPSHGFKGKVESWLDRHPFFRRHPHPALVHFPVGLLLSVPIFQIVALATGSPFNEWAAFCSLLLGSLAMPPSMVAGYFTWWVNYDGKESPIIRAKRRLAWVALIFAASAVVVRCGLITEPLQIRDTIVILYSFNLLVLAAAVGLVGFLGGKLTFPYE